MYTILEDSVLHVPVSVFLWLCLCFTTIRVVSRLGCFSLLHAITLDGMWIWTAQGAIMVLMLAWHISSGLLPLLLSLSFVNGLFVCSRMRHFFGVFLFSLILLGIVSRPLLSYTVVVRTSAPTQHAESLSLVSLYDGENLQLRNDIVTQEKPKPWSLYIYHTHFFLLDSAAFGHPRRSRDETSPTHRTVGLQKIVSIAEHTTLSGLEGLQTLVLVGEKSSIRDSTLQCSFNADEYRNVTDDIAPCFVGTAQLKVTNLSVHVHIKANGLINGYTFHVQSTECCQTIREQYNELRSKVNQTVPGVKFPSQLICCREPDTSLRHFLPQIILPSDFYASMPLSTLLRIRLPGFVGTARRYCVFLLQYVGIPSAKIILHGIGLLSELCRHLNIWAFSVNKALLSSLRLFMRILKCVLEGFLSHDSGSCVYGTNSNMWDVDGSCEMASLVGIKLRKGFNQILSLVSDAVTVVPGLWTTIHWSVNTESFVLKSFLRALRQGVNHAINEALFPLFQTTWRLLEALCVRLRPLLQMLRHSVRVTQRFVFPKDVWRWLYTWESRLLHWEFHTINHLINDALEMLPIVLRFLAQGLMQSYCYLKLSIKWYATTSLFVHFFIFLTQSVIVLVVLRNEIRDSIKGHFGPNEKDAKQRNHAGNSHSTGKAFLVWLLEKFHLHPKLKLLNGITVLARSYYQALAAYIVQHSILGILLVGLSVLPFTNKLHGFTLRVALPWVSSRLFLNFFYPEPQESQVAAMFLMRLFLALFLECTIGDVVRKLLKELFFLLLVSTCVGLGIWIWPRYRSLLLYLFILSRKLLGLVSEQAGETGLKRSEGYKMGNDKDPIPEEEVTCEKTTEDI